MKNNAVVGPVQKTVWVRAESADPQEREVSREDADALLAYEKSKGRDEWRIIDNPTPQDGQA